MYINQFIKDNILNCKVELESTSCRVKLAPIFGLWIRIIDEFKMPLFIQGWDQIIVVEGGSVHVLFLLIFVKKIPLFFKNWR